MRGRLFISLAIGLSASLLSSSASANAPDYPVELVGVVAGGEKAIDKIWLVGKSGQLYQPGTNGWRRQSPGGVASDVLGAIRDGTQVFAIGHRAPIYRLQHGYWESAPLPNRGRASVSLDGALPVASIGRHLYVLKAGQWQRQDTAARTITALWPVSAKKIYVATTRGRLRVLSGSNWVVIKNSLPEDDEITRIVGPSSNDLYALSKAGRLLYIDKNTAQDLVLPAELSGFEIHALGRRGGNVVAAGTMPGTRTGQLIVLKGGAATPGEPLWSLASGDRFAFLYSDGSEFLAATVGGVLKSRTGSGPWRDRVVSGALPKAGPPATGRAPARTR